MTSLAGLMNEREVPFEVNNVGRIAGSFCVGLPLPGAGQGGPRRVHDGKIDVIGGAGRERAAFSVPVGRRDLLHLHTERFIDEDGRFVREGDFERDD